MSLKERAKALKRDIPALFLALGRRETPWLPKLLAALAVGYALSPVDLIPDFIPVLGLLDDLLLLPGLVALAIRLLPGDILDACRKEARDLRLAKRWYCAIPFALCWGLLGLWLYKLIF